MNNAWNILQKLPVMAANKSFKLFENQVSFLCINVFGFNLNFVQVLEKTTRSDRQIPLSKKKGNKKK